MTFNVITNTSHLGERLEGGQYSADFIDGQGGNDTIVGHDGADWLVGNNGDDKIYAGPDDTDLDIVAGGNGEDEIYGGGGGDLMDGGAGDDLMGGGTGNDLMFGDSGVRSLDSYSLLAAHYQETTNPFALLSLLLTGGEIPGEEWGIDDNYLNSFRQTDAGDDTMWGGTGRDAMFGGWGDDVAGGGTGNDLVVGNRGDDTLYGASGNDALLGGDEDDVIYGGAGNDVIDGDITPYIGQYTESDGHNPDPHAADPKHFHPEYVEGEDVEEDADQGTGGNDRGTNNHVAGNDFLNGTEWVSNSSNHNGNDLLFGGAGDDLILGREGADTIWGGTGDDLLKGGRDDDGQLDNDTDVFGFIGGHGDDTVTEFNTAEWPEGGNDAWEDGEDVIYLKDGSYDGEFRDAVDAGHIVIDEDAHTVWIDTGAFGLGAGNSILIVFDTEEETAAFGAGNIVLDDAPEWVDITSSYQFTEGL